MEETKMTVTGGEVDNEALEAMSSNLVDMSISDEAQFRRTELNFYCEFYMQLKKLNQHLDELTNVVSVAGQEKLYEFFHKVRKNTQDEVTRQKVERKIRQGHKRKAVKKQKQD